MPILLCDCQMLCICFLNRLFLKPLLLIRNIMTGYTAKKQELSAEKSSCFFIIQILCPRVLCLWSTNTRQQILFPKKPFAVAASLPEFYWARRIRAAAWYKQFHIALFFAGGMVTGDFNHIGLIRSIAVFRGRSHEISERKIGLSVAETVVEK